ncbi:MAG: hypothetical protein ABIS45_11080 [Burkholderiales bacterium]
MSDLEELEFKIKNLPTEELSKFRAWFIEFDHLLWDKQIDADSKTGKLNGLVAEARADYQAGKAREI